VKLRIAWQGAGWLIAAALMLLHAWMLHRFTVNFPLQDDFTQFLAVPGDIMGLQTFGEKIAYLVSSSGDHRIVTLRLAALFQAKFFGEIDFRWLVYWGNLLCVATGLLVLLAAPLSIRVWLAPLVAALFFSPTHFIAHYWASASLQHCSMLAYAFGAIFCLSRSRFAWQPGALLLALGAVMTGANGLLVLPIGAVLLYASGRVRMSALWVVLAVAFFALYFIGHQTPPGRPPLIEMIQHPVWLAILSVATLGSMGERFEYAIAIGAIVIAAWVWLIAYHRMRPISPLLLAWMGFAFLCVVTIAIGRAPFGVDAVLNSRYRVYSAVAIIITVIALGARVGSPRDWWLPTLLLPLTAMWFWWSWGTNLPFIADLITQQRSALDHYLLTGEGIYSEFPPKSLGDSLLKRAYEEGYFRPVNDLDTAASISKSGNVRVQANSVGLWSATPVVDASTITVRGFMKTDDPHLVLWLEDGTRLLHGALRTQRMYWSLVGADWMIFWNTLLLHDARPGRYRVGYSSGSTEPPVVTWTDGLVDVR
jgi:hypothetical protein